MLEAAEGRTLVVCPAMIRGVWDSEAARWAPDLDLETAAYSGLCVRGEKGRVLPVLKPEYKGQYDTLIFDEAHYLKGRDTAWVKAAIRIQADRVWLASGTPMPNWANELFMLLQILHPGDRRFTSYWRWVKQWFPIWQGRFGRKVGQQLKPGRTWDEFHHENLGDVYLGREWEKVGPQLPPLRRQEILCPMVPAQRAAYRRMKKEYTAEVAGTTLEAWSDGEKYANLIKITTGLELVGGKGSGKFDRVRELMAEWQGRPVVVVCQFRATARHLTEILSKKHDCIHVSGAVPPAKRFAEVERFQRGEGDVLIATIESISEGVTITRANRMVFVEQSYRPSRNEQMMRRIRRLGQASPQLVVDLVTEDSVDQRVRKLLGEKTDQQMKALRKGEFADLL